jgi:hypothetical protein
MLWLEETSTDASRRAAAALRTMRWKDRMTAMLTTSDQGASAPLHTFVASSIPIEKEEF